jgi:hypothetical protein|tara:strand:- start:3555 stop:4508 length:954 start_codon:yes stop_codon:yes gene_type:complete
MAGRWPALDFEAEKSVYATVHAYLQVIGKLPTRALPWCNHSWHIAMLVVPTGFRTYPVQTDAGEAEILLDCLASRVVLTTSDGRERSLALTGQSVAAFHAELSGLLRNAGIATSIDGGPNEVEEAIPFAKDVAPREWHRDTVGRLHRAFADAARVMFSFRTSFVGKSSPVHLFWGSFDLAVTRFSGREAPLHPGGFPNLPDEVTREAYSHEVASFGFWPGGGAVEEAAFYAYGYPTPEGLAEGTIAPDAAHWHTDLGEFVLPYAAVRAADDPDAALLEFLESAYRAVATRGDWDRAALDIPLGRFGEPYDLTAHRRR